MHHHRADDLPAYLVIVIVGHIVVGGFMGVEATSTLSTWQHLAIWAPLTLILALACCDRQGRCHRPAMGIYMHGFGGEEDRIETHPEL